MMNEMSKRHENEQFICDIQMFNRKNIDFDEWIALIEKVSNSTGKPEYVLALAKSSGTPYKMIAQISKQHCMEQAKREIARSLFFSGSRCACSHRSVKKTVH